ncbi:hypothetical protein V8G54_034675 [Vigna mungo]|uniref:Uncharacterized protein n=1 Tax=Vigna mungo TaxID=3915 RepID=A0AAQ3MDH8_VIGMU
MLSPLVPKKLKINILGQWSLSKSDGRKNPCSAVIFQCLDQLPFLLYIMHGNFQQSSEQHHRRAEMEAQPRLRSNTAYIMTSHKVKKVPQKPSFQQDPHLWTHP